MVHARGSASRDVSAGCASRPDTSGRWQRLFRGQQSEVRQVRRWLTALLADGPERDDLTSVAVELATNAIQHTVSGQGGWFTVELACHGPVARIAVTDEGGPGAPQTSDDPMSDCGRGLVIVQALSQSCGVRGDSRGRTVWAEVPCPAPAPAAEVPDGFLTRAARLRAGEFTVRPPVSPGPRAGTPDAGTPPGRNAPPDR